MILIQKRGRILLAMKLLNQMMMIASILWLNTVEAQAFDPRTACVDPNALQKDGVCVVTDSIPTFRQDTSLEFPNMIRGLIIQDTQIKCKTRTGQPCSIKIKMSHPDPLNITLQGGSHIEGSKVIIDAPDFQLHIKEDSWIDVSARSTNTRGSNREQNKVNGAGASYIASGGSKCLPENSEFNVDAQKPSLRYSSYDILPDINIHNMKDNQLLGSMGEYKDNEFAADQLTRGGGHIHINVDSLYLQGNEAHIRANGGPDDPDENQSRDDSDKNAGSGGYIYIKTWNTKRPNIFDEQSRIEAKGGYGRNNGYGGSGGIIIFEGDEMDDHYYRLKSICSANGGQPGIKITDEEERVCGTGGAGTIYFHDHGYLDIDNKNQKTTQMTELQFANRGHESGLKTVSQNLVVVNGAHALMRDPAGQQKYEALIPYLWMTGPSRMTFEIKNAKDMTLYFDSMMHMEKESWINFDYIQDLKQTQIKRLETTEHDMLTSLALGRITFTRRFEVDVDYLQLLNDIKDEQVDQEEDQAGHIGLFTEKLTIREGVELIAPKITLFANQTIDIHKDVKISSAIDNECYLERDGNQELYECMNFDDHPDKITYQYLINNYNKQYGHTPRNIYYARRPKDMQRKLQDQWNVYLFSIGSINIQDAKINGPRVGICSNEVTLQDSNVNTDGRGCKRDQGLGAGIRALGCSGSGGAHGGHGGYGGLANGNNQEAKQCKANSSYPKSYYFGKEAKYEGSGGASGDIQQTTGGDGGGLVWITATGTTTLSRSQLSANGLDGDYQIADQEGSGGGAGGSIQLTTLNLVGKDKNENTPSFVAQGGRGSERGGGGGAGGRLVMNYLQGYLSKSQPDQSYYWYGTMNIDGGKAGPKQKSFDLASSDGERGTMFHTKCFPGYSGVFCSACEPGTYKYDYSFGVCLPCQNKPKMSNYWKYAESSSNCDYECKKPLESKATNKDCLDPLSLLVQRQGNLVNFFGFLGIFVIFSLIIFYGLSKRAQAINFKIKSHPWTLYETWEDKDESQRGFTQMDNYKLKDSNIWSHTHRMYLIGNNSIGVPWFIPKDFPRDALKKQDKESLTNFIDEFNPKLEWTVLEKTMFMFTRIIFPPLGKLYHSYVRKSKFKAMQKALYLNFPLAFWGDKTNNKSIRLGCSETDYQLAYIDFIDFAKNEQNWIGLKLPMPILLAGAGTFNNPYNLDFIEDSYAKSLVMIKYEFFKDKLPVFLENFNCQLNKLSFYKLRWQVMADLSKTVQWLERANQTMFNHFGIKCVLYLVENQYKEVELGKFRQTRRSFPLESIFFEAFPEMFESLLDYVKQKQISRKSEIRLALVFKKYTKMKKLRTNMRIESMVDNNNSKTAYQLAVNREESVLFDETDKDQEDVKIQAVQRPADQRERSGTSANLDTMVDIHNDQTQKTKAVKLVDKTRRAFSISIESSKAFELAIRKPRRKLKHKFTRVRAQMYGLYLLLMKHFGSPTKSNDLNMVFALFAAVLTLDIMLLVNYTYHIFMPKDNFNQFGWAFFFMWPLIPYLSPLIAFIGAFLGSNRLLKMAGSLNSMMIQFNVPATILLSIAFGEDVVYYLLLCFMVFVKVALSAVSAKVRMYLVNPRYQRNQEKLKKILQRQQGKIKTRDEILGVDTAKLIDDVIDGTKQLKPDQASIDTETLRDKLLEN